ncbi:hypothetical protein KFK09_028955 [Dendrobium nobile]|uniref:Uncharacterized protein n=1 Tax=Dendrobium nobile TaxID=94219 RepID=A0A8T3A3B8_DENNO|nr:hypothetical protein KFK09_028955 [Dendrobium nobile]
MQIPLTLIFHVQVSFFMFDDFFSWSAILVGVERLKKLANTQTKGLSRSGLTVGKKLRKVAMKIFLVLFAGIILCSASIIINFFFFIFP